LDFAVLAYLIVALFLAVWFVSLALWKLGRFDQRYAEEVIRFTPREREVDTRV
jgi:hypothetical protein